MPFGLCAGTILNPSQLFHKFQKSWISPKQYVSTVFPSEAHISIRSTTRATHLLRIVLNLQLKKTRNSFILEHIILMWRATKMKNTDIWKHRHEWQWTGSGKCCSISNFAELLYLVNYYRYLNLSVSCHFWLVNCTLEEFLIKNLEMGINLWAMKFPVPIFLPFWNFFDWFLLSNILLCS